MNRRLSNILLYKRLKQLGLGLLLSVDQGDQSLPPAIVRNFRADGNGAIAFTIARPYRDCSGLYPHFAAEIRFYNKELPFYLLTKGEATLELQRAANGTGDLPVRYVITEAVLCRTPDTRQRRPGLFRLLAKRLYSQLQPACVQLLGQAS